MVTNKRTGKQMFWQVHTENLFKEILNSNPTVAIAAQPLKILGQILYCIGERAIELNDPELNSLCCRLTLFTSADKQHKDFDPKVMKFLHKWDAKVVERLTAKPK